MLKNITLSAEETMINAAREKAKKKHTTLNNEFRRWLDHYVKEDEAVHHYHTLMEQFAYAYTTDKFSRDEMNER